MNEQNEMRGDDIEAINVQLEREEGLQGAPKNEMTEEDIDNWAEKLDQVDILPLRYRNLR